MVKDALNLLLETGIPVSKNFNIKEFFVSDYADKHGIDNCPPTYVKLKCVLSNILQLAKILEIVRAANGCKPIYITSGYRCPTVNKAVGGVIRSYHQDGAAVDITAKDYDYLVDSMEFLEIKDIKWYANKASRYVHIQLREPINPPPTRLPDKALFK